MGKRINIDILSAKQIDEIKLQIEKVETESTAARAVKAKKRVDFYYKVKGEIEDALLEQLEQLRGTGESLLTKHKDKHGAIKWSKSKILKQIANMPARMPTTDAGFIKRAREIEYGKPRKITKEQREKRKLKAAEKDKKTEQRAAARTLFKKNESARKKAAAAKRKKVATHKSAGAMATQQRLYEKKYEDNRKNDPELREKKNAARRLRRENGNTN
jgi:hypothetical protein